MDWTDLAVDVTWGELRHLSGKQGGSSANSTSGTKAIFFLQKETPTLLPAKQSLRFQYNCNSGKIGSNQNLCGIGESEGGGVE